MGHHHNFAAFCNVGSRYLRSAFRPAVLRRASSLLVICIVIVEVNSPIVAVLNITRAGFLWALLVSSLEECVELSSAACRHG